MAQRLANQLRIQIQAAIQIQSYYRKYVTRKWYLNLRESVIKFQAHVRGFLARRKFEKMMAARPVFVDEENNE